MATSSARRGNSLLQPCSSPFCARFEQTSLGGRRCSSQVGCQLQCHLASAEEGFVALHTPTQLPQFHFRTATPNATGPFVSLVCAFSIVLAPEQQYNAQNGVFCP